MEAGRMFSTLMTVFAGAMLWNAILLVYHQVPGDASGMAMIGLIVLLGGHIGEYIIDL